MKREIEGEARSGHDDRSSAGDSAGVGSRPPGVDRVRASDGDSSQAGGDLINSRYEVVRRLGRGGMGAVFLATDTQRDGQVVALKRVRSDRLDDKTLATLRNEFLSLSALQHPNLARVFDFGLERETGDVFFTTEFVDGPDWQRVTRDLDLEREEHLELFLSLLVGVLRALEFIHCQGLVHLDLKPENVLIRGGGTGDDDAPLPDPGSVCPKVIDFGLARREGEFGGKKIMGTTYYIAPETILGARVDRRTDLYSLGVLLYQLATGRLPFRGKSNLAVFKGHLEKMPRPPEVARPGVPPGLGRIILCLMEKKAADRYQNALEVIEDIEKELGCSFPLETGDTIQGYLESGRAVGREDELRRLHAMFGRATKTEPPGVDLESDNPLAIAKGGAEDAELAAPAPPEGRVVILRGETGLGKRQLARRLRALVQTQGACALEVECGPASERAGQDFFNLVRELLIFAGQQRGEGDLEYARRAVQLARRLKKYGDESDDKLLAGLPAVASSLLHASRATPFHLHLHDFHAAGLPVTEFVRHVLTSLAEEEVLGARCLVTASALDQADTEGTRMQGLYQSPVFRRAIAEHKLERLDSESVGRLLRSVLVGNDVPDGFLRRVMEESDGNTEIVLDIIGLFLEKGLLRRTPMGWILDDSYQSEAFPGKARLELKDRINQLPGSALKLAMAFAYLGEETELDLAVAMASLPPREADDCVSILRQRKLVQERIEGDPLRVYTFVHSSARDILYQLMPEKLRPMEHDRAGSLCEEYYREKGIDEPWRLAYHFLRAQNREKGVQYGIEAARRHESRFEPERAIALYEEVLELVESDGSGDAGDAADAAERLRRDLARLRFEVGDHEGVIRTLEPLVRRASEDGGGHPDVYMLLARAHGRLGRFDTAAQLTQEILRWQEENRTDEVMDDLLLACGDLHFCKGNIVESLRCADQLRTRLEGSASSDRSSRLYMLLAESHFRLDNQVVASNYCQEALRLVDSRRDTQFPDVNLFCLARFYKCKGKLLKAVKQFELASQLSRKLGASDRRADSLLEIGKIQGWLERPQSALPALEQANALYRRTGNVPMSVEVLCELGETRRMLGQYDEARRSLDEALRRAETLGNRQAQMQALLSYAGLALDSGDLDRSQRYLESAESKSRRVASYVSLRAIELRFELCVQRGEISRALDQAAKALVSGGQVDDRLASAALLAQRATLQCRLGRKIDARRALVMLLDIARSYGFPLGEGRARLLEGMILTREGKSAAAERSYLQAAEIFRQERSERDLIQLYLEHGMLSLKAGNHEDAYLYLEEGFYLAKKLHLNYMKTRYYYALGQLEIVMAESSLARAEERLRLAEQLASQVPYPELLWQVEYMLGRVYDWDGRNEEAAALFARSSAGRIRVTDSIPMTYRQAYLRTAADDALEVKLDEHIRETGRESSVVDVPLVD